MIKQSMIEEARQVNLVEYCEHNDFEMKHEGDGNYRLKDYTGLIIKDNYFNQFGSHKSGNAIDFCTQILGMNFRYAVKDLLSFKSEVDKKTIPHTEGGGAVLEKKNTYVVPFVLPEEAENNSRVYAYLTKSRGLPGKLINDLIDDGLLYQDTNGNCVFPCLDCSCLSSLAGT